MAKNNSRQKTDVEICRDKIKAILTEYNCWAWITDLDTLETAGDINPK